MTERARLLTDVANGLAAMRRLAASPHVCPAKDTPTRAQFGILLYLAHSGPQCPKDLAKRLCITPSAATQLVNGLVKEKLIARTADPDDKRQIRLSLTAAGKRRLQMARKHLITSFSKHLEPLTDAELRTWRRLQEKVLDHRSA